MDRETKMGPVVSKDQYDRVNEAPRYRTKRSQGPRSGGGRASPVAFEKGYYIEPTIFYDVDNSALIAREEIFGPVAYRIPFDAETDAVRIANDTPYGLAAAVWSARHLQSLPRGQATARRHRLGQPHAADLRGSSVGWLQTVRPPAESLARGASKNI